MSEIINKFKIFCDFPPNLIQNVKSFYVTKNYYDYVLGYCVLNDNKVYGFGEDIHMNLGYYESEEKYVLINELNDKNIIEFYRGYNGNFMFARNNENEIFSWGWNCYGQLARGFTNYGNLKPQKVDFFDGKNIIEISCADNYCIALSSDGSVFECGYNGLGSKIITIPIKIEFNENIKFIHCMRSGLSFAVSFDGNLYYWGKLLYSRDKLINNPIRLNTSFKIKCILNTIRKYKVLYVLSFEGIIYGLHEEINQVNLQLFYDLTKEMKEKKVIDICVDYNKLIFQTEGCVYVYNNSKNQKTSHKTLFEYFLFEEQITYKTLHLKENQIFVSDFERNENNSENLIEEYKKIYSNEKSFNQNFSLNKIRISKDLPQILESNVKYYYQSGSDYSKFYFGFFVMKDNRVYCFGYNSGGKLGLGHNDRVFEYTEIIELRDKDIQQFYEGCECMFARNNKNEIFSWGMNHRGQLGRGYISEKIEYLRPEKFDFFNGKGIIDISCGDPHCLALSSDGSIYGWGCNKHGEVGCGESEEVFLSIPIDLNLNGKIKFIHCNEDKSFAVSFDGNLYYWGHNRKFDCPRFSIFNPKLIPLKKVFKVYCDYFYAIILDENGIVFKFNIVDNEIIKIKSGEKFIDIISDYERNLCLLQSEECVYLYKFDKRRIIKTAFINFFDYYYQKSSFYMKTIKISKDGYLMGKQIHFNEKDKILILIDKMIFDRKYESYFDEIKELGKGGFGTVYEVEKKSNKVHYAIKRIQDELNLNEIKIMSELNNNFVVQYIDSWIEGKVLFKKITKFVFIQMELCSYNLRQFIDLMNKTFDEKYLTLNYFIYCELFRELTECLDYLHSLKPSIIHRDLKPENVLISDGINGRFLKLCDFGLAKFHKGSLHTRMVGTLKYMAPEVKDSDIYNIKSDIYSLALIATEIFKFEDRIKVIRKHENRENFDKYLSKYLNSILENNFKKLLEILSKCLLEKDYHLRPDCKQLLEFIKKVTIDYNIILNDEKLIEFESSLDKKENFILKIFFDTKIIQTFENQNNSTFNYSVSHEKYIEKLISTIKKYINCSAICTKAINYISNLKKEASNLNEKLIDKMIEEIILVMQTHPTNQNLQRCSLSIISNEYILEKVKFNFFLCAKIVLNCFVNFNEIDIKYMAIFIFWSINSKLSETELSCINQNVVYIEAFIEMIRERKKIFIETNKIYYMVMQNILSTLVNLTALSHETCKLVLSKGGLDLWLNILNELDEYPSLMGLILIVLNNIAEVSNLRSQLMRDEFLLTLRESIKRPDKSISYLSSGILVNLCCDQINWINSSLQLSEILNDLERVILKWKPIWVKFISFFSLIPLIPLLSCFELPVIQLWAIWTIHHLFSHNTDRYYEMLVNIDGIIKIESIIKKSNEESDLNKQLMKYCKKTLGLIFQSSSQVIERTENNWRCGQYKLKRINCRSETTKGFYCLQYDDYKIISGLRDNTIKILDRNSLQCSNILSGHTGSVLCLQYDERVIISGSSDATVRVWDVKSGQTVNTLIHHREAVLHLRFNNEMLITCSNDNSIAVWHMTSPINIILRCVLLEHRAPVNVVDLDEKYIISGSGDRTIKVWNTSNCELIRTLVGHTRGITCLQYRDRLVVSGSYDKTIRLWNIQSLRACLRVLEGHEGVVGCIGFDDKRIISGASDGIIKVWDMKAALDPRLPNTTLCSQTLDEQTGRVFRLQFDEFQIISSHYDTILIWDFLSLESETETETETETESESESEFDLSYLSSIFIA